MLLGRIFGLKYKRMFPLKIGSEDIDYIIYVATLLKSVEGLRGFKRHIRGYSKETAAWLTSTGLAVEFEPETPEGLKDPDLKCQMDEQSLVYIECKRIRTDKFFDLDEKQKLADLIYEKLPTCDQLNFYLSHEGSADKVRQFVQEKSSASTIFRSGMQAEESTLEIEDAFSIGVIPKPTIIGDEDDYPVVSLEGWLEDIKTGVRLPGYVFMRGGRPIGIHGPLPNYRRIWNKRRTKSKKQAIPDHPFVTIMLDEDVLGDPAEHDRFFDEVWLTECNAEFSGIGILSFVRMPSQRKSPTLATQPIHTQSILCQKDSLGNRTRPDGIEPDECT